VASQRLLVLTRWVIAATGLAAIVAAYRLWLHVNPTTVALSLLLLILSLAARWGLTYAVVVSVAATLCYNFFFMPPLGTWTITDPQNWIAVRLSYHLGDCQQIVRAYPKGGDGGSEARTRGRSPVSPEP
jgi:two-component system sensor histidine kinase KdpD